MNIFRLLGDLCHLTSKIILIATIHSRRSAEGISLLTQLLYMLVFATRYLDLFRSSVYNAIFKIFYLASSAYILWVMLRVFKRTREEEREWRITAVLVAASAGLAPILSWAQGRSGGDSRSNWFIEVCWTFSIVLESVAVLPQLSLLRHTAIPTAITSYYLLMLGMYRALYIPNWIMRRLGNDGFWEPVAYVFGVIQTILYIEFGWIYWRRQKIKIRDNGAILDGEDFLSGGLVLRWIGKVGGPSGARATGGGWRGGGISVSADDVESGELVGEEFGDSDDESGSEDLEVEVEDGADSGAR